MKQNTIEIPSGCKAVTWENTDKGILLVFEPEYVEGQWYYVPHLNNAFRCTAHNTFKGSADFSNNCYEAVAGWLTVQYNVTPATTEQIEATLTKVAEARGYEVGCETVSLKDNMKYTIINYCKRYTGKYFSLNCAIYDNTTNEWAEIIEQPKVKLSTEQIEAVVDFLNKRGHSNQADLIIDFRNEFKEV